MGRVANINLKEAMKMVSKCNLSRLPLVMELLEQEGYYFSDGAKEVAFSEAQKEIAKESEGRRRTRQETYAMKRAVEDHREWQETDDATCLALRKAYMDGVSMTAVARHAEIRRERLYRYLYGIFTPPTAIADKIMLALEELS